MSEAESPAMACFATGHSKSSRRRLLVAVSGNVLPIPTSFPRILQPLMYFYLFSSRAFLPDSDKHSDKRYLGLNATRMLMMTRDDGNCIRVPGCSCFANITRRGGGGAKSSCIAKTCILVFINPRVF